MAVAGADELRMIDKRAAPPGGPFGSYDEWTAADDCIQCRIRRPLAHFGLLDLGDDRTIKCYLKKQCVLPENGAVRQALSVYYQFIINT
ncbi:MAG TPA: hypothetical protein PK961_09605 [bacterium]|nr:hypothetical protein [bacterium]